MQKVGSESWRGRIIVYAPLLIWIAVIFFLSSPQGSMAETSRFIGPIIAFFFPNALPDTFLIVHMFIRKAAHFTEYGILALLAVRTFSRSNVVVLRNYPYVFTILLVFSVASIDEFNQSFEPSRTSSFNDVLLDLTGGTVMLILSWIFGKRRAAAAGDR